MKSVITTLTLLLGLSLSSRASDATSAEWPREWSLERSGPYAYDKELTKNTKTYAHVQCDFANPKELICEFILHDLHNKTNTITCIKNIIVPENLLFKNNVEIERLGHDSILLKYTEGSSDNLKIVTNFQVLKMSSCQFIYKKQIVQDLKSLPSFGRTPTFITYDNGFEIVDYNNKSCGANICRTYYDNAKGLEIYLTLPSALSTARLIPVNSQSPHEGFFALNPSTKSSTIEANYVDPNGEIYPLTTLPANISNYWIPTNLNGKFGICFLLKNVTEAGRDQIECAQFENIGKILISQNVNLNEGSTILGVHNLNEGGFLILMTTCYTPVYLLGGESCTAMQTLKIDKFGDIGTTQEIESPNFNCHRQVESESVRIIEEDNEDCFYFGNLCRKHNESGMYWTFNLDRKCVVKSALNIVNVE